MPSLGSFEFRNHFVWPKTISSVWKRNVAGKWNMNIFHKPNSFNWHKALKHRMKLSQGLSNPFVRCYYFNISFSIQPNPILILPLRFVFAHTVYDSHHFRFGFLVFAGASKNTFLGNSENDFFTVNLWQT